MERMKRLAGFMVIFLALIAINGNVQAQYTMPEVMENGTLQAQKDYLENKTNIYNGYRAVRDDIFIKMLKNSIDSLNSNKQIIINLNLKATQLNSEIESLSTQLSNTKTKLGSAIQNKDSLVFFGIPMNKVAYNMLVWGIIAVLAGFLVIVFLMYKRSYTVTNNTRNDLKQTKDEFETYRKSSREKHEKLVISHFNEIKRLKENS